MSFARFSDTSDVYVFASVNGGVECCGCTLNDGLVTFTSFEDLRCHLLRHREAGHLIPEHLLDPRTYEPDDFAPAEAYR